MQYYQTNYLPNMPTMPGGTDNADQSQKDDEERRKKLAAIAGMITGLPLESITGAADYSMSGQQAPVVDSQPPVQVAQQQGPVMPEQVQQERQAMLPAGQTMQAQAQPAAPVNPYEPTSVQLTPEATQDLASKAGITSSVNPADLQLPQPGPAVQVAGTQPSAGVSEAANATVPGTGLKPPSQYQPYIDQFKSGDLYSLANPKAEAPQFIKTAAQEQLFSDFQEKKAQTSAQQKVDNAIAQAASDPAKMMKVFDDFKRGKTEESSWASIYLLKKFGFDEAANEELAKKGYGARFEHTTLPSGEEAMIKYTPKGEPLSGISASGQKLSASDLIGVSPTSKTAMYTGGSKLFTIPKGQANEGEDYSPRFNTHSGKYENIIATGPNAGKIYTGTAGLEKRVGTAEAITANKQEASKGLIDYRLAQNLKYAGPMAYTKAGAAFAGKYNTENDTNIGYNRQGVLVDHFDNNKPIVPNKDGTINATQRVEGKPAAASATQAPTAPTQGTTPGQVASQDLSKPPAYDNALSPLANKELQKNWAANRKKITTDFITGKQGQTVQSLNVAVDHLDTLADAAKALNNGDVKLFNQVANAYSKNTGEPAVTDFNALKTIVGSEVAKAVAGGATALGDREEIRAEINAASSEKQLLSAINKYQRLMAGQVNGLRQTYVSSGLPAEDFDNKLLPRTKKVLGEAGGGTEAVPTTPAERAKAELERRKKGQP